MTSTLLVVLVLFVILFGGSGWGYSRGYYGGGGFGIIGVLLIVMLCLLLFGGLGAPLWVR